jgi:hypothetical protein
MNNLDHLDAATGQPGPRRKRAARAATAGAALPAPPPHRLFTLVSVPSRWGASFVCHSAAGSGYVVFQAKSRQPAQ